MTSKRQFDGERVKLGELISKAKVKRCGTDEYPVLSMTMHDGIVEQAERFKKAIASKDTSSYKVVNPGQLVVGFPIDEGVLYVQNFSYPGIMSPAYNVWDIDHDKVDSSYLELALHGPRSMTYYKDKMRGTTARRRSITDSNLLALEISLPPMEAQEEIVALFQRVEDMRIVREDCVKKFDTLVKSRFVEMFGDPVRQPKWPVKNLGELCSKLGSGATPRGGKSAYKEQGTPLIRSMNVHNGIFVWDDLAFIDEGQAKKLQNATLERGDVLLNITGASVARSCILPDELEGGRVNQHVAIVRADKNVLLPCVLNATLINDSYQQFLLEGSRMAGATREAITKQDLKNMHVPVPPLSLQQQFADFVTKVDKPRFVGINEVSRMFMQPFASQRAFACLIAVELPLAASSAQAAPFASLRLAASRAARSRARGANTFAGFSEYENPAKIEPAVLLLTPCARPGGAQLPSHKAAQRGRPRTQGGDHEQRASEQSNQSDHRPLRGKGMGGHRARVAHPDRRQRDHHEGRGRHRFRERHRLQRRLRRGRIPCP